MKKRHALLVCVLVLVSPFGAPLSAPRQVSSGEKAKKSGSVSITLLESTDTHGRIEPWDYYADKPPILSWRRSPH